MPRVALDPSLVCQHKLQCLTEGNSNGDQHCPVGRPLWQAPKDFTVLHDCVVYVAGSGGHSTQDEVVELMCQRHSFGYEQLTVVQ